MFIFFAVIVIFFKINAAKIKGLIGEARVNIILRSLGTDYTVLADVMIKNADNTTSQIDHLVLSEYGIFVIETKNYKGWIFGNEKSDYWQQVIFKEKTSFPNPVKQNWGHVYALKNILTSYPYIKYHPIVVFVGNATLKNIDSSVPVIYKNQLKQTIKDNCNVKCLSKEDVIKIKELLDSVKNTNKGSKKEHITQIKHNLAEKQYKMNNLICPRCNGNLKIRNGKNGTFYGCSNYPKCTFTMPY